ncbi:hypothetical protein [Argonema antarcticum]|uniref:hypothetical protein n=1 Tax=Argonema antarcticum TaxID=2942763 RepID=UPI002011D2BD|nr:hypothetical protein [Argonema antarcticum]MCL1473252.1 hypothetical protein [Argonema antarcticum A004/B2]
MSFSNYKSISAVLKEFQITYTEADFIIETPFNIPQYFREDLQFVMREGVVNNSEFAICENLIYPVLKETWKCYFQKLILWSHQSLNYDEKLSGFPEYIIAKRSKLGKVVFEQPYLLLVEAKQDKFEEGWGQCLAEMVAAQRLNAEPSLIVFGIVSNGKMWQFGKLQSNAFIQHTIPYSIYELDQLFAAVNYIFQQCILQLDELVAA